MPCDVMLAYKVGGKKEGEDMGSYDICLPKSPVLLEMAADGK